MRKSSNIRAFFLISFVALFPSNSNGSIQSAHQNVDFLRFDSMDQNRSLRTPRQQQNSNSNNSPISAPEQITTNPNSASSAPLFQPINNDLPSPQAMNDEHSLCHFNFLCFQFKLSSKDKEAMDKATSFTNSLLERLGLAGNSANPQQDQQREIRRQPTPALYQSDDFGSLGADLASNRIDLQVCI
jgi:hypothetical protein